LERFIPVPIGHGTHRMRGRLRGERLTLAKPLRNEINNSWVAHTWRCLPCVRPEGRSPRLAHIAKGALYAPPDALAKPLRMRQTIRNSQNEPGMSAGINDIENRGGEDEGSE